jgi:hypothetical protein
MPSLAVSSRRNCVGNLDQDAGAVAEQGVVAGGAAVRRGFPGSQALLDDGVAFLVLDMGDKADAAGVMLVRRVVQTLALGEAPHGVLAVHHARILSQRSRVLRG